MKVSRLAAGAMALIVPATVCFTGCSWSPFNSFSYTYENADKYTAGDREIDDTVTKINIDYVSGDVKVKGTDTDSISVKETANKDLDSDHQVHTWVDGDTLYVRYCVSTNMINFGKIEKSLEITIPSEQELDDFIIDVSSGNIDLDGFTTDNLNSHASSGNMTIDCSASVIELKSSSGNVGLTQTGNSDSVKIKASSGNVALIHDGDSDSITIDSSSGKINVEQKGTVKNVKIHSSSGGAYAKMGVVDTFAIDVSSGGIVIDAEDIRNLSTKASSGHSEISLGKVPETSSLDCSSGGIDVRLPEDADVTVHVDISSGEFNYNLPFEKNGKDYIGGNGTADMKIHCSSGNVNFNKI